MPNIYCINIGIGDAWASQEYNNIGIINKINIYSEHLCKAIMVAGRRRKAVPAHLAIILQLFIIIDSIQA